MANLEIGLVEGATSAFTTSWRRSFAASQLSNAEVAYDGTPLHASSPLILASPYFRASTPRIHKTLCHNHRSQELKLSIRRGYELGKRGSPTSTAFESREGC